MQSLATLSDLTTRGIPVSNSALAQALLDAASAAIREAAGSTISRETSTVKLWTEPSRRIELPARPVVSVDSVKLDGVAVTGWSLRGSALWREEPWQAATAIPAELEVTFTHGYAQVPADVVNLCCMLVGAAIAASGDGFAGHRGLQSVKIDDYAETFATDEGEVIDPLSLPERTRAWLRARFGRASAVTGSIR